MRLLHARTDRVRLRARRGQPEPEPGRDPARDGGEPVPLRHGSEDRGGGLDLARLIRTEKEVDGRLEVGGLVVDRAPPGQGRAAAEVVVERTGAPATGTQA